MHFCTDTAYVPLISAGCCGPAVAGAAKLAHILFDPMPRERKPRRHGQVWNARSPAARHVHVPQSPPNARGSWVFACSMESASGAGRLVGQTPVSKVCGICGATGDDTRLPPPRGLVPVGPPAATTVPLGAAVV